MNKEYSKNKYYTSADVKEAQELAVDFYNKEYTPQLLRTGNKKLGSNVAIFDLPSIVTCKYKCKDCYALKAERIYKRVRLMRAFHYEIIKMALKDEEKYFYLQNYINTELKHHALIYKNPVVRLHASGDFFSNDYFNFWIRIICSNMDIKFYTYTKVFSNDKIDRINNEFKTTYKNFNIVKSMIDDKYINYGSLEYLEDVVKVLETENKEYFVCTYGSEDNHLECMGNCTKCLNCSNVLFRKH